MGGEPFFWAARIIAPPFRWSDLCETKAMTRAAYDPCPKCKQNGLRASREYDEEMSCLHCGYVKYTPLREIKVEPFEDEIDAASAQNGRYGYRRVVGEGLMVSVSETQALSRILELAALGVGWYAIAETLNAEGFRNRRGKEWAASGVRSIALKEKERMEGKDGVSAPLFDLL